MLFHLLTECGLGFCWVFLLPVSLGVTYNDWQFWGNLVRARGSHMAPLGNGSRRAVNWDTSPVGEFAFFHTVVWGFQQRQKGVSCDAEGLFKPLLWSYLFLFCWPKQLTWPSLNSKGREISPTSSWQEWQRHSDKGRQYKDGGAVVTISANNLPHCLTFVHI